MADYRILGPLEVLTEEGPLALAGLRQRALLALLLTRPGELVPSERLVDQLYGEDPPKTAATSLQNSISQLRKLLGADVLETRTPGYVLRVDKDTIDAQRFERLVREARTESPAGRAATLRAALELWRGPVLAEFAFEPFAQPEIRRLSELRLTALEDRIDADLELDRHAELVGELEALVESEPLRERLRGQLMLALYRSGRQAEALSAYQEARRDLTDELGIEPSPSLQRLQSSILRQEAGLERASGPPPASEVDVEVADAILHGRVVLVVGHSGSSELAERLGTTFSLAAEGPPDLSRVSQHIATLWGSGPLYDTLHDLFEAAVEPGPQHRFAASLSAVLRARGIQQPLIVTTHYDLALEQAFADAGEPIDVVSYAASGRHRGRFWHRAPEASPVPIEIPNTYVAQLSFEQRPVVLKLRGAVDTLPEREWESFVITEDDYIEYLAHGELASVLPVTVAAKLRRSHFLFLGYAMSDWSLRLILGRIWGGRPHPYSSWAVQAGLSPLERAFWRQRDVDVLDVDPDAFVELLARRLVA